MGTEPDPDMIVFYEGRPIPYAAASKWVHLMEHAAREQSPRPLAWGPPASWPGPESPFGWLPTVPGTYLEFAALQPARARPCWSCRWGPRRWARRRHWQCGRALIRYLQAADPAGVLEQLGAPRGRCEACGAAHWRYWHGAWCCGACGQTPGEQP